MDWLNLAQTAVSVVIVLGVIAIGAAVYYWVRNRRVVRKSLMKRHVKVQSQRVDKAFREAAERMERAAGRGKNSGGW